MPSGWCLAESRINTFPVDDMTLENGLRSDFTQAVKSSRMDETSSS